MVERKTTKVLIALLIIGIVLTSGCLLRKTGVDEGAQEVPTLEPTTVATEPDSIEPEGELSQVKVSVLYERVTDGVVIGRTIDEVVNIFKDTKTDFILRGFFRWNPVPNTPSTVLTGYPANYAKTSAAKGYTYQQYSEAISEIKTEMPDVIFCGAITAQRLNRIEYNPITHETLKQEKTWDMAFDPEKWNFDVSKKETQCKLTKSWNWISSYTECPDDYNPKSVPAYFPDITNEKYQELLLSWAKKQIDIGADAIWIDMLFKQANIIQKNTGDPHHPAVKESYEASSKIVDDIHEYGESKGKYIYVGTWWNFVEMPYPPPDVDFVTATPEPQEVMDKKLDEEGWLNMKSEVREKSGDVPIFVFLDFGNDGLPLAIFSQKLTKSEQKMFLKEMDEFFHENKMNFVYPVHGGFMGASATKLSFGEFKIFDLLSPEFENYGAVKELIHTQK
jgi:hypothetical protein